MMPTFQELRAMRRAIVPLGVVMMVLVWSNVLRCEEKAKDSPPARSRAAWLKAAKYGVLVHFLPSGPNYQKEVDAFDVKSFAVQMEQAGAAYVFFTLGQNSGHYCSPNKTYEHYLRCKPNARCSRRDLPMELADALAKRNIRLMLYLPSRAPQQDKNAMDALSDVSEREPAPQEFTRKWSEVIREWSKRYGKKVSGWWCDGAYNTAGWDDRRQPQNWTTWAAACRAANADSLLAFNPGTDPKTAFRALCDQQDYTAGECHQRGYRNLPGPGSATG
jgi:hypothetical protein